MSAAAETVANRVETRGERRRESLIDAAGKLFLEHGFDGTSLDMIIAAAGGSRRTLYEHFGGKEGLLVAAVRRLCEQRFARLVERLRAADLADEPPERALQLVGNEFLDAMLKPKSLALYRVVTAESARLPELGTSYYEAGGAVVFRTLTEYLKHQSAHGRIRVDDPEAVARAFIETSKGDLHLRAVMGVGRPASRQERRACVDVAVQTFLRGILKT